jgi:hypothetical protein
VCGPAFCILVCGIATHPVRRPKDGTPFRFRPRQRPPPQQENTELREPCSARPAHMPVMTSPALRLRYPQDGRAGPVPLQNVSRSFPVGQDGGIIGQNGSAGISLSKEQFGDLISD